jgi:cation/acetate symporter
VRAARVSAVIVGALAILIGIAAKGQNVAHLVALAFAVAASSNLPCVLLTLYWKRCNTGGIVLGMLVGAFSAIALVMVSPNMTYPKLEKEKAQKIIDAAGGKVTALEADLAAAADPAVRAKLEGDVAKVRKEVETAQATMQRFEGSDTSLVGLEAPLIGLRNPGLYSIPLGFLCVILGSLFWRDRKAEDMWDELYVRQNTGIHAEQAVAH